jgi:hypothetical protein
MPETKAAEPIVISPAREFTGTQDILLCMKGIGKQGKQWNLITVDKNVRNNPILYNVLVKLGVKEIDLTSRV